ncbi:MAG TPA: pectin acetylesterase-family hydrolase [Polyangia bacterium]|nr:pectin acetylesterase-family hydrolase [Polyangia bacterium]
MGWRLVVGYVALAAVGVAACSSPHASGTDGAMDAVVYVARDHNPDTVYADAGPPAALGTPLPMTDEGQWDWIDFPETRCRDGSATGLAVNFSSASPNVMVFLDQGGSCFNLATCILNDSAFGEDDFIPQTEGVFNRSDPDNPVRDWSYVFIPYCSGDVHAGKQPDGAVDGVGPQQFMGYTNLDAFLSRVVPTFAGARQVLFAGSSAGGFGVLLNADHVAQWFAPIPVTLLSDSGPPMPNSVVQPCLEQTWHDTWGFSQGVMLDCGADCPSTSDYMIDNVLHFGWRYPSYRGGLISSTRDSTIDWFFSFGSDGCQGGATIPPADFQAGLLAVRGQFRVQGTAFGTYYISDTNHIWLMSDEHFNASVNGVTLKQWVADLLAGSVSDVGP